MITSQSAFDWASEAYEQRIGELFQSNFIEHKWWWGWYNREVWEEALEHAAVALPLLDYHDQGDE